MLDFTTWPTSRIHVDIAGRTWALERIADLETLWDAMEDEGDDNHIPYWVELWPASLVLARWLEDNPESIRGKRCLDLGCGLGLTALIASSLGARVVALDYEWPAVYFARKNTAINQVPSPLWVQMDWCRPAFRPAVFDCIWGGDILYEQRFFEPIATLFDRMLAPKGRIILGTPERTVTQPVWGQLIQKGWQVREIETTRQALHTMDMSVKLMQLTL
ncbi:class I SAM-dependent methyltransferase [Desulfoplanes formicivorans]|uniref:Methyltransferase type 11 n=1 Tax=Desulfoplanes formicivorans TaxID=1592317 RepID=A0A194AF49_9BACT|nr:methyltransferase domain-containing protein [Desulfoplanes formicivorans]GAU07958.1 methyltransferase type 11 [Desulfoplanes formicivorans]